MQIVQQSQAQNIGTDSNGTSEGSNRVCFFFFLTVIQKNSLIHDGIAVAALVTMLPIYHNTHAIDGTVMGTTNQYATGLISINCT